jgi:hypothetical protein
VSDCVTSLSSARLMNECSALTTVSPLPQPHAPANRDKRESIKLEIARVIKRSPRKDGAFRVSLCNYLGVCVRRKVCHDCPKRTENLVNLLRLLALCVGTPATRHRLQERQKAQLFVRNPTVLFVRNPTAYQLARARSHGEL